MSEYREGSIISDLQKKLELYLLSCGTKSCKTVYDYHKQKALSNHAKSVVNGLPPEMLRFYTYPLTIATDLTIRRTIEQMSIAIDICQSYRIWKYLLN